MITRDNQILLLRELKRLGANIQPIDYWKFQSEFALKNVDHTDMKPCLGLLESRELIKVENIPIIPNKAPKLGFIVWLTDLGFEEIDKYDKEISMEKMTPQAAAHRIKNNLLGYDFLIDKIYNLHGIDGLNDLDLLLLDAELSPDCRKYLDKKIKRHKDNEELDFKSKKRQAFWFYPTLITGALAGTISLLGQLGIVPIPKIDLWHKENTTLISPQTKRGDSTHNATILIPDSTKR